MAPKDPLKFTSPATPPERSTMTRDEIEEIYHQMEKRISKNREQMEHEMDETMKISMDETMKISMDEMENKMDNNMN
jgi:ClpP class serine protease